MIIVNNKYLKTFNFPGGEVGLKTALSYDKSVSVVAMLRNSNDILELLLLGNALKHSGCEIKNLTIPYIPYARQDRICNKGEPFSIKLMAELINSLNSEQVFGWDVHSDVTSALINNFTNIPVENFIPKTIINECDFLVSPDSGSLKKIHAIQTKFEVPNEKLIVASKVRDVSTGNITNTKISINSIGGNYLIIDDICDGGRTFIELAKKIKNQANPDKITLFVTHGIFSKGIEVFDRLIDEIYTTDSFCQINHPKLTIKRSLPLCIETDQVQL